jgi:hypothetical protein
LDLSARRSGPVVIDSFVFVLFLDLTEPTSKIEIERREEEKNEGIRIAN